MGVNKIPSLGQKQPGVRPTAESLSLSLEWLDAESMPIQFANQFMIQSTSDEVVLTVGQLCAPILTGDESETEQLRKRGKVYIRAVAKVGMSKSRLREFVALLRTVLALEESKEGEHGPAA